MSKNNTNVNSGIGFTGLLTIAFIVLKLCKIIDWSWLWVLSPIWISFAFTISIFILIGVGYIIYKIIKGVKR